MAQGADGKYFATSLADAKKYGDLMFKDKNFYILAVDVSDEIVSKSYTGVMDWMTAIFVDSEHLSKIKVIGAVSK